MVLHAIDNMWGGELYVPKIPSYRITDVAQAIAPDARLDIVGIRPGEKLHEDLITETDALSTVELASSFVILPATPLWDVDAFIETFGGCMCPIGFRYNSGANDEWLSVDDIRKLVREHVDPSFEA